MQFIYSSRNPALSPPFSLALRGFPAGGVFVLTRLWHPAICRHHMAYESQVPWLVLLRPGAWWHASKLLPGTVFFTFKEPDSIKAQKSKPEFPLICPWFCAYVIPLISFAWEQKQIPSLLVELILQGYDPNQKAMQESQQKWHTNWLFYSHSMFLCTFMYIVHGGMRAEENNSWAALPLPHMKVV